MTSPRTHVVVVGGGYAGAVAANHLRLNADIDITVVNARPVFVERIRLHQLAAGSGTATVEYGTLLGEGIELIVDTVDRIDSADHRLLLASGAQLDFDYLIYAVGSTGTMPAVPGAAEFAYSLADLDGATRLRHTLVDLPAAAPVVVVGGGLTGIEAASELAEQGRPVTLVCGGPLGPSLSKRGRRSVAKQLRRLGVAVLESVSVSQVRWDAVVLSDHIVLPSAATVWTAGFEVPDLAARSGLRTDGLGRLLTDETLTSPDDDRIVAAGDCAAPSGRPLRMSCQAAGPLGPRPPIPCSAGSRAKPRPCSARRSSGSASAWAAPTAPCSCPAPTTLRSMWSWGAEPAPRSRKRSARARCGPSDTKPPNPARTSGSKAASGPRSCRPSDRLIPMTSR
ncbi:FAD binding domain protein [Mycobacterium kansasii 732]|nr:FAD binding domain protein [Mycobacterium kansasii 732]